MIFRKNISEEEKSQLQQLLVDPIKSQLVQIATAKPKPIKTPTKKVKTPEPAVGNQGLWKFIESHPGIFDPEFLTLAQRLIDYQIESTPSPPKNLLTTLFENGYLSFDTSLNAQEANPVAEYHMGLFKVHEIKKLEISPSEEYWDPSFGGGSYTTVLSKFFADLLFSKTLAPLNFEYILSLKPPKSLSHSAGYQGQTKQGSAVYQDRPLPFVVLQTGMQLSKVSYRNI